MNLKERVRYHAPHLSDDVLTGLTSSAPGPLDQLEAARTSRALAECMAELPEVYQSALRLHYWLGLGLGEVAELLVVPENTVKSYLHRARRLLHVMLQARGFEHV